MIPDGCRVLLGIGCEVAIVKLANKNAAMPNVEEEAKGGLRVMPYNTTRQQQNPSEEVTYILS